MRNLPPPARPGVLGTVGRACYRHPCITLAAWTVGTACLITLRIQFGAPANNNLAAIDQGQRARADPAMTGCRVVTPPGDQAAARPGRHIAFVWLYC